MRLESDQLLRILMPFSIGERITLSHARIVVLSASFMACEPASEHAILVGMEYGWGLLQQEYSWSMAPWPFR